MVFTWWQGTQVPAGCPLQGQGSLQHLGVTAAAWGGGGPAEAGGGLLQGTVGGGLFSWALSEKQVGICSQDGPWGVGPTLMPASSLEAGAPVVMEADLGDLGRQARDPTVAVCVCWWVGLLQSAWGRWVVGHLLRLCEALGAGGGALLLSSRIIF